MECDEDTVSCRILKVNNIYSYRLEFSIFLKSFLGPVPVRDPTYYFEPNLNVFMIAIVIQIWSKMQR